MNVFRTLMLAATLFVCLESQADDEVQRDSIVISACIRAIVPRATEYALKSKSDVVYVHPEGESSIGLVSEAQLHSDLDGADWDSLSGPIQMLRGRLSSGWSPPPLLAIEGFEVVLSNPPEGEFGHDHLHFLFWPPGYSSDQKVSVVRALFGPTPHGASATCEISFQDGKWLVVKKWFSVYL